MEGVATITLTTKNGPSALQFLKYEDDVVLSSPLLGDDPPKKMQSILDFECDNDEELLCCYPKCGTHWVSQMILKLKGGLIDHDKSHVMGLEFNPLEEIASLQMPRVVGTHLWPKRLPKDHVINRGKVVLLLRNPKDVAVSYYHHLKNASVLSNKQTWEEFLDSFFFEGSVIAGSYFDYLEAWGKELQNGRGLNIEVFFYDDIMVDCFWQLKRLATFLNFERSESELRIIADECSFESMKTLSRKGNYHNPLEKDKDGFSVIYRRGCVGDWKNQFTVEQNERFDDVIEARGNDCVFNFKYTI